MPFVIGALLGSPLIFYYLKVPLENKNKRKTAANIYSIFTVLLMLTTLFLVVLSIPIIILSVILPFQDYYEQLIISYKIVLFSILFLLGLVGFYCVAFIYTHNIRSDLNALQYEKYGRLRNWSKATKSFRDKYNWDNRFTTLTAKVIKNEYRNKGSELTIIAPSANNGNIENLLAQKLSVVINKQVKVFASDIAQVEHISSYSKGLIDFYYKEEINGSQLLEVYPFKCDVIFDVKGFLWHELNSFKKKKKSEKVMDIYYELLKPGGIVIVDGYTHRFQSALINLSSFQLQLFGRISWFAEKSTYEHFKKIYNKSNKLKKRYNLIVEKEGIASVAYFQKI